MTDIIRITRFTVDPANLDDLLTRRAALVTAVRAAHGGPVEARLTCLADGTFADIWRWESGEQLDAAVAAAPSMPETAAAFALARDVRAETADLIDEH